MAKIAFTKLNAKKNIKIRQITFNDQEIEIFEYLPIEEKLALISRIVNYSLDDNNFANPARLNIYTVLELVYTYTNISFTAKQRENFLDLYDTLITSGLWKAIFDVLKETGEYDYIQYTTADVVNEIYKYRDSILGILNAVQQDYQNLNLDAAKIQEKIADKDNLTLLKNVVTQLGG